MVVTYLHLILCVSWWLCLHGLGMNVQSLLLLQTSKPNRVGFGVLRINPKKLITKFWTLFFTLQIWPRRHVRRWNATHGPWPRPPNDVKKQPRGLGWRPAKWKATIVTSAKLTQLFFNSVHFFFFLIARIKMSWNSLFYSSQCFGNFLLSQKNNTLKKMWMLNSDFFPLFHF